MTDKKKDTPTDSKTGKDIHVGARLLPRDLKMLDQLVERFDLTRSQLIRRAIRYYFSSMK
ncbi:MAG: ribbon-helix-helix protein, CopG family [Bacteroidetes bacterium]|nr:ribbon-helix-helix protein, CopG family [Bacteroidota bacterium]